MADGGLRGLCEGVSHLPNVPIELTSDSEKQPSIPIEPKIRSVRTALDGVDFGHWQNKYGRELSEIEKIEIVGNLSEFFSLLKNELGKHGKGT